jgi:hypothetical protein
MAAQDEAGGNQDQAVHEAGQILPQESRAVGVRRQRSEDQRGYRVDRNRKIAKQARREAKYASLHGDYSTAEAHADVAQFHGMRSKELFNFFVKSLNERY